MAKFWKISLIFRYFNFSSKLPFNLKAYHLGGSRGVRCMNEVTGLPKETMLDFVVPVETWSSAGKHRPDIENNTILGWGQWFTLPSAIGHSPTILLNVWYTWWGFGHFSAKCPIGTSHKHTSCLIASCTDRTIFNLYHASFSQVDISTEVSTCWNNRWTLLQISW